MKCQIGIGHFGLAEQLSDILAYIQVVRKHVAHTLAPIAVPQLPNGISIYFYFTLTVSDRVPIHMAYEAKSQALHIRLELSPSPEISDAYDLVAVIADTWSAMVAHLERYLIRRKVSVPTAKTICRAFALPSPKGFI